MQAIILAGGLGTRLRSVVSDVPKPMAELAGRPFLEYLLLQLRRDGFGDAVICSGYRGDAISNRFGDGTSLGMSLAYSVERQPLGTAGALRLAAPHLRGDRWLLMNADSFFDISLVDLLAAHERAPASATLALAQVPDASRYGGVTLAPDGLVTAFVEKPPDVRPGLINGGLYIIERHLIDLIPADRPASLEREVLPPLVGTDLRGVAFDAWFIDIGMPADYRRAQADPGPLLRLSAAR